MLILADTGVLLRILDPAEPLRPLLEAAILALQLRGDEVVTSAQNIAEFWNVCTRPSSSRGGYGLSLAETARRLTILDGSFSRLSEHTGTYGIWRNLVVAHYVQGRQVHDARLVALMQAHGITHILTLNGSDFARYPGITAIDPSSIPVALPPPATP